MGRSPEAELIDLFSSLFSAEELRRWASLTFEREVTNALPESGVSLAELAFQLAFVLGQRGHVTDELFKRLIEERPGRRDDILRVARLLAFERGWGVRELDLRESDFSTLSALFKTGFEEDAADQGEMDSDNARIGVGQAVCSTPNGIKARWTSRPHGRAPRRGDVLNA